jgi:cardiolipin synthase A/B
VSASAGSDPARKATALYTQTSGPLKNRHARALEIEADGNGLILRKTKNPPLHGKFVTWDDDDVVITSLNWASAASDPDFPWADIGIHIKSKEIGAVLTARLDAIGTWSFDPDRFIPMLWNTPCGAERLLPSKWTGRQFYITS